jgi:hypothetical protein
MGGSAYHHNRANGRAHIRFEHNVAGAPNVDVYANGNKIVSNLGYTDYDGYLSVAPGRYNISVRGAGSRNAFLNATASVEAGQYYTVIVHGDVNQRESIGALILIDNNMCPAPGQAHIRFVHATPSAPTVDIWADGQKVFSNIAYGSTSQPMYLPVAAGFHKVAVTPAGSEDVALGPLELDLADRGIYTIIAAGKPGDARYPLTAVVINEPDCM